MRRRSTLLFGLFALTLAGCDRSNNPILPGGDPAASTLNVLLVDGSNEKGIVTLKVYVETDLAPVTDLVPGNFFVLANNLPVVIDVASFKHLESEPGNHIVKFNQHISDTISITVTYGSLIGEYKFP